MTQPKPSPESNGELQLIVVTDIIMSWCVEHYTAESYSNTAVSSHVRVQKVEINTSCNKRYNDDPAPGQTGSSSILNVDPR
jgi:hypothetical protein